MIVRLLSQLFVVLTVIVLVAAGAGADQNDPRLERLFSELAAAGSAQDAARIETRIWAIWLEPPPGPDIAEAMQRGLRSMALGEGVEAVRAFDRVVALAPDYAEGWNKRATVRYMLGDLEGSIRDISRTLALEPRHFGALAGLGLCRLALDEPAKALAAFDAALRINPNLREREQIEALREQVEGKPL